MANFTHPRSIRTRTESGSGSQLHSFQTFGQYSEFLRSSVADEESLQVGESLQVLSAQIEALLSLLGRMHQRGPAARAKSPRLAKALMALLASLRQHRAMLLALGAGWQQSYEFEVHFGAINQFRILLTQWSLDALAPRNRLPPLADFDLAAWRVLGAGALLLDVHEQLRQGVHIERRVRRSGWARWRAWWKKNVRGWPG
ncbi:MAG: hypothetical protein IPH35_17280 [Rhodoferax sp.]|nr:hypothetical protein [Rhodoferax sp.]